MTDENIYAAPESDVQVDANPSGELAGLGARLLGAIVDVIVMIIAVMPLMFMTGYMGDALVPDPEAAMVGPTLAESLTIFVISIVVFLVINGYPLATRGQTVGKMAAKTRIVSVADGKILSLPRVVGMRYLPIWLLGQLPLVGMLISIVDTLFIFRSDRRCIHDLIAGTHVVTA